MKKRSLMLLSLFALLTSCGSLPSFSRDQSIPYDCFAPGDVYNDTDGNLIQAHGGQISQYTYQENGETVTKYVWIGEDRKNGYYAEVNAYSSTDLYNWDFEGTILKRVPSMEAIDEDSYFNSLYSSLTLREREDLLKAIGPTSVIERPKLLYNAKNDNYVLWFHQDGYSSVNDYYRYGTGNAAVAVSDSIFGPYRFIASHRLNYVTDGFNANPNSLGEARDMNLFLDDDNQAYIVYTSENNKSLFISRLNEDYTDLAVPASLAKEGEDFTRKPPKLERYVRPVALRWKKANVTHPQLGQTFLCPIISVKKNPNGSTYTGLGVITKGTIIEVNVSKMGLVTPTGRIIWSKFAQVTNTPENEGCINSVLLV